METFYKLISSFIIYGVLWTTLEWNFKNKNSARKFLAVIYILINISYMILAIHMLYITLVSLDVRSLSCVSLTVCRKELVPRHQMEHKKETNEFDVKKPTL